MAITHKEGSDVRSDTARQALLAVCKAGQKAEFSVRYDALTVIDNGVRTEHIESGYIPASATLTITDAWGVSRQITLAQVAAFVRVLEPTH